MCVENWGENCSQLRDTNWGEENNSQENAL